jgi:hypothetical protein
MEPEARRPCRRCARVPETIIDVRQTGQVPCCTRARFVLPQWAGVAVICFTVVALAAGLGYALPALRESETA